MNLGSGLGSTHGNASHEARARSEAGRLVDWPGRMAARREGSVGKKRKRRRVRESDDEPLSPEALRIHRELRYLRAAGLTRKRKPSAADRIRGRSGGKPNHAWVAERFEKLKESRREVASG